MVNTRRVLRNLSGGLWCLFLAVYIAAKANFFSRYSPFGVGAYLREHSIYLAAMAVIAFLIWLIEYGLFLPRMISPRLAKIVLWVASFVVLFPISARIADPLATRPWNPAIDTKVLLLWPDRIELRPMSTLAEFSPRPANARYSFLVPPGRQNWVEECLRNYPLHTDASWIIRIKQTGPSKQRIQLEVMGDGFWGMVYEATPEKIVPLGTRLAGPAFAFVILGIHLACWGMLLLAVYAIRRLVVFLRGRMSAGRTGAVEV